MLGDLQVQWWQVEHLPAFHPDRRRAVQAGAAPAAHGGFVPDLVVGDLDLPQRCPGLAFRATGATR